MSHPTEKQSQETDTLETQESYNYFLSNIQNLVKQNSTIYKEGEQTKQALLEALEKIELKEDEIQRLKQGRKHFETVTIKMANELSELCKFTKDFKSQSNSYALQIFDIEKQIDDVHTDSKRVQAVLKTENTKLQNEIKSMLLQLESLQQQKTELQEQISKWKSKYNPLLQEKELLNTKILKIEKQCYEQNQILKQKSIDEKNFEKKMKGLKTEIEGLEQELQYKKNMLSQQEQNLTAYAKSIELVRGQLEEKSNAVENLQNKVELFNKEKMELLKAVETQTLISQKDEENHKKSLTMIQQEAEIKKQQFMNQTRQEFEIKIQSYLQEISDLKQKNEHLAKELQASMTQSENDNKERLHMKESHIKALEEHKQQSAKHLTQSLNEQKELYENKIHENTLIISNLRTENEMLTQKLTHQANDLEKYSQQVEREIETRERVVKLIEQKAEHQEIEAQERHKLLEKSIFEKSSQINLLTQEKQQLNQELSLAQATIKQLQNQPKFSENMENISVPSSSSSLRSKTVPKKKATSTPRQKPAPAEKKKEKDTTPASPILKKAQYSRKKTDSTKSPVKYRSSDADDEDVSSEDFTPLILGTKVKSVKRKPSDTFKPPSAKSDTV